MVEYTLKYQRCEVQNKYDAKIQILEWLVLNPMRWRLPYEGRSALDVRQD